MASITITGFVQALSAVQAVGAAGKAVNGPLVTLGSRSPYIRPIETGMRGGRMWRRAGPARMTEKGIAAAGEVIRQDMPAAIVRGPQAVGAVKRKARDTGLEVMRANTPVRSGKLRASASELNRPGIG